MPSTFNLRPANLIRQFTPSPARHRGQAWAWVAAMVAIIVVADFSAGIEISLAIFYLVPALLSTAWPGLRAGTGVAVACTLIRVLSDFCLAYPAALPIHVWWNAGAELLIFLLVVRLLASLLMHQRRLSAEVSVRTTELVATAADRARLQQELLDVSERERGAIGRELHDELGQQLVATAMAAQILARKLTEPETAGEARAIVGWVEAAVASARKIARGLILTRIEPERFEQELEDLAAESSRGGVRCRLHCPTSKLLADATECAQLFRIAQEAVNNAWRHASASVIDITVDDADGSLCLIIEDDGRGMRLPAAASETGMGLRTMEHRARAIGATLAVLSSEGEGTRVICQLRRAAS